MSVHFYTSLIRKPRRADGPDAKVAGNVRGGQRAMSRCYRETAYFSSQAYLRSIRYFSKKLMSGKTRSSADGKTEAQRRDIATLAA
jgi:hypothetical protein